MIYTAKQIGSKSAFITCLIVILIFIIPSVIIDIFNQRVDVLLVWQEILFKSFIGVGVLSVIVASYFLGAKAGESIVIKKKNWIWVGLKTGFLLLWIGSIAAAIGMFIMTDEIEDPHRMGEYILGFLFITTVFGSLPLLIIGFAFGYSIKYQAKKDIKFIH